MIQQNLCGNIVRITQNNCLAPSKRTRMVLLTSIYNIYKYVNQDTQIRPIKCETKCGKVMKMQSYLENMLNKL